MNATEIRWVHISNGNIDQLNFFVFLIVDELDFTIWIEKKNCTMEMKHLTNIKCEWKTFVKLVKIYGKPSLLLLLLLMVLFYLYRHCYQIPLKCKGIRNIYLRVHRVNDGFLAAINFRQTAKIYPRIMIPHMENFFWFLFIQSKYNKISTIKKKVWQ